VSSTHTHCFLHLIKIHYKICLPTHLFFSTTVLIIEATIPVKHTLKHLLFYYYYFNANLCTAFCVLPFFPCKMSTRFHMNGCAILIVLKLFCIFCNFIPCLLLPHTEMNIVRKKCSPTWIITPMRIIENIKTVAETEYTFHVTSTAEHLPLHPLTCIMLQSSLSFLI
jgi:hypothetical protein